MIIRHLFLFCILLLCSCSHTNVEQGRTVEMHYARNIGIETFDGYRVVRMKNPWREGELLHTYILIEHNDSARMANEELPEGTVVYTPLRRSVVFNTAHTQLISWLVESRGSRVEGIAGVADLKYMLLPHIHKMVAEGQIADCGNSMAPDIEKIMTLHADGLLLSPFENSGGYGRLEQIGVPIIECAEYMESSPLGRMEWMRFYGMIYGRERQADSLFSVVEKEYQKLKNISTRSSSLDSRPSLLTEKLTGSTWYVPGGKSTVAQMITDAGARCAWSDDKHAGSLALSFETVLSKASDADVWIFNANGLEPTYERLVAEYDGYRMFRAFKERNIWYVNSLKVPYFEEVSFRPDRLLRDYILMLHPGVLQGNTRYYRKLKE